MDQEGQIPNHSKAQPWEEKGGGKNHINPSPVQVDDGDENVVEKLVGLYLVATCECIQVAVFETNAVLGRLSSQHVE